MPYYVQNFSHSSGGTTVMYRHYSNHNHDEANQFSLDALTWLQINFHWDSEMVAPGHFRSNQPEPLVGHEI